MGDRLTHECGLALVRLRKDLGYYQRVHGDALWGLRRLFLLMEKQHNRGQDGAGIAAVRFDMPMGEGFMDRLRTAKRNPIERLFDDAMAPLRGLSNKEMEKAAPEALKRRTPLLGEAMIGHLRYGTHGGRSSDACHPYLRRSNTASRNMALAGNFNLTNSAELFSKLVSYGLNPVGESDTGVVLEKLGYNLDREHDQLVAAMGPGSFANLDGRELADEVSRNVDINRVIHRAAEDFDGGFVLVGLLGNGDCFVCRDPYGIRPAFLLVTDEVIAVASERPPLAGVFDAPVEQVQPLPPGHSLVIKRDGSMQIAPYCEPRPPRECTFERIYFSRGNDHDIYQERKRLGRALAAPILERLGPDPARAVFSFIPNTSETAYLGLVEECDRLLRARAADAVRKAVAAGSPADAEIQRLANAGVRAEKVAHKDQRLRTFITHDAARRDLVAHIYDITRGVVTPQDTLVVIDDSIVRGTTLRDSIVTILSRLNPARIIIASSAPPIMYPDCYGIDMSQLGRFIAFEAAVNLAVQRQGAELLVEVERHCIEQQAAPDDRLRNHVKVIYDQSTPAELAAEVSRLLRSRHLRWPGQLEVIYQSIAGLRQAMPSHTGDWYFTGDYPTPGGFRVLNRAYLNWRRSDDSRAY